MLDELTEFFYKMRHVCICKYSVFFQIVLCLFIILFQDIIHNAGFDKLLFGIL